MKTRIKIPQGLQLTVLYKSANTCVVCRIRDAPIEIHHIDENPSNNTEENLIVLCKNCHGEAHTHHDLSQNLTQDKLKDFKNRWEEEVRQNSIGAMVPSMSKSNLDWSYFNFAKIPRAIINFDVNYKNSRYEYLKSKDIINDEMEILNNVDKTKHFFFQTLFDNTNISDAHILCSYYKNLVDMLITKIRPFELGAIWNRTAIKSMIAPGCYVYLANAMYFKTIKTNDEGETKEIYMHAKGIKVTGFIYTNYMFGSSSQYNFFCSHKAVSGLYFVKDVAISEKYLTINVTPIALGVGTWSYIQNTPYLLRNSNW